MDRLFFSLHWLIEATRRRFWILAFFAVVVFGATFFHLSKATPLYRAMGVIEIQPENPPGFARDEVSSLMAGFHWTRYIGTQELVLENQALAHKALERVSAADKAAWLGGIPDDLKAFWKDPRDLALRLSAGVQTESVPQTFLMRIYCTSPSAEASAGFINALTDAYIEHSAASFGERKRDTAGQLSERTLPELERSLSESVDALNKFLGKEGNSDLEQRHTAALDRWKTLSGKVGEVRLARLGFDAKLSRWEAAGEDLDRLSALPEVRDNAVIRDLRAREVETRSELTGRLRDCKELHPEVVTLKAREAWIRQEIERELGRIRSALKLDAETTRREEEVLREELGGVEQLLSGLRSGLFQLKQLQTRVDTHQTMYNTYYAKFGETTAVSAFRMASVRIVEPAQVPRARFSPRWSTAGVMAAIFFLLGGAGLLLLFERLDDTIRSSGEPEAVHGLVQLTAIPSSTDLDIESPPLKPLSDTGFGVLEAFRRLRTDVLYRLMTDAQRRVVVVVSSGPGEGKTTTALRLAESMALMEKKVLLVDGDLRRPSLHKLIGKGGHADLVDVLTRSAEPGRVIRTSAFGGIDAACAAQPIPNPTELLGGAPFREFMEQARRTYDVIIIDTPPVLLASDALILAKQADVCLLVLRIGVTRRRNLAGAISELKALGIVPAGIVLNAVPESHAPSYGYGYAPVPQKQTVAP